jgi:hypothetical protein
MEPKTSSGQILIECALGLFILALLFSLLLDFDGGSKKSRGKTKSQIIKENQMTDLSRFKNGN